MSIKIDTGMYFPIHRLTDFQRAAHLHITNVLRGDVKVMLDQAKGMENGEFAQYARGIERHTKEQCECGFNFFVEKKIVFGYYWGNNLTVYTGSNLGWVTDFSYWDDFVAPHKTKPGQMSEVEWDRRKCQWTHLMSHIGEGQTPWNRHLSWKVIDGYEVYKIMQSLVRRKDESKVHRTG